MVAKIKKLLVVSIIFSVIFSSVSYVYGYEQACKKLRNAQIAGRDFDRITLALQMLRSTPIGSEQRAHLAAALVCDALFRNDRDALDSYHKTLLGNTNDIRRMCYVLAARYLRCIVDLPDDIKVPTSDDTSRTQEHINFSKLARAWNFFPSGYYNVKETFLVKALRDEYRRLSELSSLLIQAIKNGDLEMVKKNVEAGADVNEWNNTLKTCPVRAAIGQGGDQIFVYLLSQGMDVCSYEKGATAIPLVQAITESNPNVGIIEKVLQAGASIKQVNQGVTRWINDYVVYNNTPLAIACMRQAPLYVIGLLLQYGADPTIQNSVPENKNAFDYANNETRLLLEQHMQRHELEQAQTGLEKMDI
ncbi:MAG: ankyrin repeat domain-containing protein [Epsilonproteobacteria bacterium]|nr:ankyrin repeat domain-containing protein [Campylobacterota bacterium]